MNIFEADDPLVLDGTYDTEGYTPKERRAQDRKRREQAGCDHKFIDSAHCLKCGWLPPLPRPKGPTMKLFDTDRIGCYLDDIGHRVEKTKDGREHKMVDLTLRVQPFTPDLATALDPGIRAFLFGLTDGEPKPMLKKVFFNLTVDRQTLAVRVLPEVEARVLFSDVEITDIRARTEKGVDGFALVFYASFGPVSADDLEYICEWLTQQRFIDFDPMTPALNFDADERAADNTPEPARRIPRRSPKPPGDTVRPGVHAEH